MLTIRETGSTLLFPLFNLWVPDYATDHPELKIVTEGTGSGTGISAASDGKAEIGASDAYMTDAAVAGHAGILNIPLAISAQQINYNLPELGGRHLRLNGQIIARIYSGAITAWNDRAIIALNPGAPLPAKSIIPVYRSEGSGDTFLFTQFLSQTSPAWKSSVGSGVSVQWPSVHGGFGAKGNSGVVDALVNNPYAIGYVGVSWQDQAAKAGLGEAELANQDGSFVLPTAETVASAAQAGLATTPPDERVSLILEPGAKSYPIINYEYAIVQGKQPSAATAQALRTFLTWALDPNGGESASYLEQIHFQPLPPAVVRLSQAQIDKILN